eukprot:scaffold1411_cov252-Pinguiococcus_pyrenoidosus.AAC.24
MVTLAKHKTHKREKKYVVLGALRRSRVDVLGPRLSSISLGGASAESGSGVIALSYSFVLSSWGYGILKRPGGSVFLGDLSGIAWGERWRKY